jgi:DNA-binding IclR family transcriptional regulator
VHPRQYANVAQQRVLRTLRVLIERAAEGAAPGEIAAELNTLPSNTTRDLANLHIAGFAEADEGLWRLSPRLVAALAPTRPRRQRGR